MAKLPLDLLASFVKVAECTSVTFAARELGLSKATVSKQISELETRLGIVLFARSTRSIVLTAAGQRAFARARKIVDEAELIVEEAHEIRTVPRGRLAIAAPQSFAELWLADILPDFLAAYPEISLELSVNDRTVDLLGGGFDGALRINAMPDSSLIARKLANIRLCLVGSPDYWAKHGQPVHPSDLANHACVRYSNLPDKSTWHFVSPTGQEARVKVNGSLTVNGGNIELPALRAGLGIALLPDFAVYHDVRNGTLVPAAFAWRAPDLTLHLLTPPGRGKPKRLEVFTDFLIAQFGGRAPPWDLSASIPTRAEFSALR